MTEPVTTLDTRFSDPDAVPTDWHETRNVLETAQLFWISTVPGDGRPHVTPLVAVWLDDVVYFTTGPDEQKAVNLRAFEGRAKGDGAGRYAPCRRAGDYPAEGRETRLKPQARRGKPVSFAALVARRRAPVG